MYPPSLAAYAEEEARSVSENQMWRIEKQFQQGKPTSIDMFGYAFVKGRLEIIPEEAALIREAAKQYLDGATQEQLETIFNEAGVVGRHGKKFTGTGIITLLCNEKVVGDLLLQKTRCIDPITKVQKVNHGEWPQYFCIRQPRTDSRPGNAGEDFCRAGAAGRGPWNE